MYLSKLHITHFKNFEEKTLEFSPKINAFVGNNGIGKTNLLDAIYYLGWFKSYFNLADKQNIQFDQDFFLVEGWIQKNEKEEHLQCSVSQLQGKLAKRNQKTYNKLADHVGKFPVVIISPYDRDLISDGSDVRRKFVDSIISQADKVFLADLIRYNKVLSQRNALLKYFAANRVFDAVQLSIFDQEMLNLGQAIFEKRKNFIDEFKSSVQYYYEFISNSSEKIEIIYRSDLEENNQDYLEKSQKKDLLLQYSSSGVHKDEFLFEINQNPIKKFGSQGQQKSFLIALKLAQLHIIKEQLGINPILLLDDVFDKLDENRVEQLIKLVNQEHFGQIFLSDTHAERTQNVLNKIDDSHLIFHL